MGQPSTGVRSATPPTADSSHRVVLNGCLATREAALSAQPSTATSPFPRSPP